MTLTSETNRRRLKKLAGHAERVTGQIEMRKVQLQLSLGSINAVAVRQAMVVANRPDRSQPVLQVRYTKPPSCGTRKTSTKHHLLYETVTTPTGCAVRYIRRPRARAALEIEERAAPGGQKSPARVNAITPRKSVRDF